MPLVVFGNAGRVLFAPHADVPEGLLVAVPVDQFGGTFLHLLARLPADGHGAYSDAVVDNSGGRTGVPDAAPVGLHERSQSCGSAAGHCQAAQAHESRLLERVFLTATEPDGRVGLLDRLGVDLAQGNLIVVA